MELRLVIAENIARLMSTHPDERLRRAEELARLAGISRRTLNRILAPQNYPGMAPTLANLVAVTTTLEIGPDAFWTIFFSGQQPSVRQTLKGEAAVRSAEQNPKMRLSRRPKS